LCSEVSSFIPLNPPSSEHKCGVDTTVLFERASLGPGGVALVVECLLCSAKA
jgi:hypothetical protein